MVIELVILTVVILSIVIFLIVGKIPTTYEDFRQFGNVTLQLWDKATGADEKRALEQRHKIFENSVGVLGQTYQQCLKSKKNNCWCPFPTPVQFSDDYFLTFEQVDAAHIGMLPYAMSEEDRPYLVSDPLQLEGKLCIIRGFGFPSARDPWPVDYPPTLTLHHEGSLLRATYPGLQVEEPHTPGELRFAPPLFGQTLYKYISLEEKKPLVCLVDQGYVPIKPSPLCS